MKALTIRQPWAELVASADSYCQGLPPPLGPGGGRLALCHMARRALAREQGEQPHE